LELFRQFIARTRFRFQVNREVSLRLVVQYNNARLMLPWLLDEDDQPYRSARKSWDVDPLVTYRLSPFSVLYVGSTQDFRYYPGSTLSNPLWKLSARQYFMKLQYLFQV
jgi:hypothetical protein